MSKPTEVAVPAFEPALLRPGLPILVKLWLNRAKPKFTATGRSNVKLKKLISCNQLDLIFLNNNKPTARPSLKEDPDGPSLVESGKDGRSLALLALRETKPLHEIISFHLFIIYSWSNT